LSDTRDLLQRYSTVAVVGMSADPDKPSGSIPRDLKAHGFRIIPINPSVDEVDGERAYGSLDEVPGHIDIVEVFRPAEEAPAVAEQAVAVGAKALWLQLGLTSPQAREIAESAGLDYVENRCMGVERSRFGIDKE